MSIDDLIIGWLDVLGEPDDAPTKRCGECPPWRDLSQDKKIRIVYVLRAVWALRYLARPESATITSMVRCGPCNARRGGVSGSRHLYGESPGRPYGAADDDLDAAAMGRLRQYAHAGGDGILDWIAGAIGWPYGVGLILYGRRHVHLDLRERHYLSIRD